MNEQEFFNELNKYPILNENQYAQQQQQQNEQQPNIFSMLTSAFGSMNRIGSNNNNTQEEEEDDDEDEDDEEEVEVLKKEFFTKLKQYLNNSLPPSKAQLIYNNFEKEHNQYVESIGVKAGGSAVPIDFD